MDNLNVYVTPIALSRKPPALLTLMYSFNGFDGGHPESRPDLGIGRKFIR